MTPEVLVCAQEKATTSTVLTGRFILDVGKTQCLWLLTDRTRGPCCFYPFFRHLLLAREKMLLSFALVKLCGGSTAMSVCI